MAYSRNMETRQVTPTAKRNSYRVARGAGVLSCCGLMYYNLLWVTPTAKRNSYRVARLVGAATQGSVLRPQPWAGETQLHYLSAAHCAAPVTFGSELLLLADISTKNQLPHLLTTGISPATSSIPALPKRKENLRNALNTARRSSRPLGRAGEGLPLMASPLYLIIYIAKVIFLRFCLATLRIIINFVIHRRIAA